MEIRQEEKGASLPAAARPAPDAPLPGLSAAAAEWLKALPATAGRAPARADTDQITLPDAARLGLRSFVRHFVDQGLPRRLPPVSRLILYGSYARGDFEPDSDVDLAVVLAGNAPEKDRADARVDLNWAITEADSAALLETLIEVNTAILWEGELIAPQEQARPSYYRSVLEDGIEITAALLP